MDGSGWVVELDVSWEWRGRTVDLKVVTGGLGGAPSAPHAELVGGNTLGNECDRATPAQGVPGERGLGGGGAKVAEKAAERG